jgi:predicted nucleic acid-binding protein
MKVLDANFLIDYLDGEEATREFYEASGGEAERWVIPVPAYAEALVGEGNLPDGDRRSSGNPDSAAGVARSRRPTGCP